MNYFAEVQKNFDQLVEYRRHFHCHPECGPEEQLETLGFIEKQLDLFGIRYVRIPHGGILGFIEGEKSGKTLLLRADTDALPIQESENNLAGKRVCISEKNGVMHACGHDGHMAMLLVEAKLLKQMADSGELAGNIVLMFEESEEVVLEVEQICKYIQENNIKIDSAYATHVRWDIPVGKLSCEAGGAMAGFCQFELTLHGTTGHGSRPDLGNSVLDCFNQFYNAMQLVRMKKVAPDSQFTWSIGEVHTGTACNVLPDLLKSSGTLRFYSFEDGKMVWAEMKKILDSICGLMDCTYELEAIQFFPPINNNAECVDFYNDCVKAFVGENCAENYGPWMASETFSYMSCMYPSVLAFTGIKNEKLGSGANHHTAEFDLDEEGLVYGAAAGLAYAAEFLKKAPELSGFEPMEKSWGSFIEMLHNI